VYAHGDAAGVRRTTDQLGALSQERLYDAYGGIVEDTGTPGGISSMTPGFNGGDHLPAFGIVNIGARIYDPRTGRFLQRDPLVIPRTAGMMNPYSFAWNDPINFSDPSGMDPGGSGPCDAMNPACNGSGGPVEGRGPALWGPVKSLYRWLFGGSSGRHGAPPPAHVVVPDLVSGSGYGRLQPDPMARQVASWSPPAVPENRMSTWYEGALFGFRQATRLTPPDPIKGTIAGQVEIGEAVGSDIALLNSDPDPFTRMVLLKKLELEIGMGILNALGGGEMGSAIVGATRAGAAAVPEAMSASERLPFALGIDDHLDDFARQHGATTWKTLDDVGNWKAEVTCRLADPDQRVLFNLKDVDAWPGASRAAGGRGRATDWELLQIQQNRFPN
jgi:RHS repeat-associated protein